MEVILLENIENLGSLGDKVAVKSGFARNFLVPHGKAKVATAANVPNSRHVVLSLKRPRQVHWARLRQDSRL